MSGLDSVFSALYSRGTERAVGEAPGASKPANNFKVVPAGRTRYPHRTAWDFLRAYKESPFLRMVVSVDGHRFASVRWQADAPKTRSGKRELRSLRHAGFADRKREIKALRRTAEVQEVEATHPMLRFLHDGNRWLTGYQCRYLLRVYSLLVGDSVWILEQNVLGLPMYPLPVPPTWMVDVPNDSSDNFVIRDGYGVQRVIPRQHVFWHKDVDPENPYGRGTGIAVSVGTEIEMDEALAEHDLATFQNGARPDLLIYGAGLDPTQNRILEQSWADKLRGYARAHTPFFLGGEFTKDIKVQDLSRNLKDLLATDLRTQNRDIIRQVISRLPPELIGEVVNSNRSTSDAADYIMARGTTVPALEDARSGLQRIAELFDPDLVLDYESPVREDYAFNLEVHKAFPYAYDINEHRALSDEKPFAGNEGSMKPVPITVTMTADLRTPYLSTRVQPAATQEAKPPKEPEVDASGSVGAADGEESAPEGGDGAGVAPKAKAVAIERRSLQYGPKAFLRAAPPTYLAIERIAENLAPELRALFLASAESGRAAIDLGALTAALLSGQYHAAVQSLPIAQFAADVAGGDAVLRKAVIAAGESAAATIATQTGNEFDFNPADATIASWLAGKRDSYSAWITASATDAARGVIDDELVPGSLSAAETAAAIRDRFGLAPRDSAAVSNSRAERIADGETAEAATEGANAYGDDLLDARASSFGGGETYIAANHGQQRSWVQAQEQGVLPADAARYWGTKQDAAVCPQCDRLEGQRQPLDKPFIDPETGEEIMLPGEAHQQTGSCRCYALVLW